MVHQAKTPSNSTHMGAYKKREEKRRRKKGNRQTNKLNTHKQRGMAHLVKTPSNSTHIGGSKINKYNKQKQQTNKLKITNNEGWFTCQRHHPIQCTQVFSHASSSTFHPLRACYDLEQCSNRFQSVLE